MDVWSALLQRVFESNFVGRRCVVKERFSKKYRHPTSDAKLTLRRLNVEARCMTKARRLGVSTPVLCAVDAVLHTLTFDSVDGSAVKDVLLEFGSKGVVEERLDDIAVQIGDAIAKLHDGGLIHGDLTTSNMLIRNGTNRFVLVDFGLSFTSTLPEDKAVDLYVLERALLSMHSSCGNVMDRILAAYKAVVSYIQQASSRFSPILLLLSDYSNHLLQFDKGDETAQWLDKSSISLPAMHSV
ncbi:EKC/KEOPS complex subunit bud32 [Linum grandiflorum]